MKLKGNKGSIAIFVLVGLLFMSAFLIIMYAANVNRSKAIQEQFNIISGIYSKGNDNESYIDAYTALRKKNASLFLKDNEDNEDKSILELTKTFNENMSNYRIYGNSVQDGTPSPDSPVEIQSVGYKVTNLIPYPYQHQTKTEYGITKTNNEDGSFTIDGTTTGRNYIYIVQGDSNEKKLFLEAGTYTPQTIVKSGTKEDEGIFQLQVCYTDSSGKTNYKYSTFTLTEDTYVNLRYDIDQKSVGITFNNYTFYPMLTEGTEKQTEYIACMESKYKVPVKIRGKNLFHTNDVSETTHRGITYSVKDNVLYLKGTTTDKAFYVDLLLPSVLPTDKYYIYRHTKGTFDKAGTIFVRYGSRQSITGGSTKALGHWNGTYSVSDTIGNISIMVQPGVTVDMEIRISISDVSAHVKNYEPYYGLTTTNIYLNEPLRKIGDKADYIDFTNKKVIRKIGYANIPASSFSLNTYWYSSTGIYCMTTSRAKIGMIIGQIEKVSLMNKYREFRIVGTIATEGRGYTTWNNGNSIVIGSTNFTDNVENNRTLMGDQEVVFVLATPTEETIDLPELQTFEDYTRIEVLTEVAPSKIEAEYVGYTLD